MNSEETTLDSPSAGRRVRIRPVKRHSISHETLTALLPSDDETGDWVSPFTTAALPPLPAFKKQRSQFDRSPEDRLHDRSGSSAYYAAAWGSPYATPSPNQSPAVRVNRNRSFDIGSSPLSVRRPILDPPSLQHTQQISLPVNDSPRPRTRSASGSPSDQEGKSQRRNWLSESEDSAGESGRLGVTPTQRRFVSAQSHHVQESVDTVTPETFVGHSSPGTRMEAQIDTTADPKVESPNVTEEKPLPNLPTEDTGSIAHTQEQPRPPALVAMPSFQRPKKKVPWKGKSCIIAMPLTDREQAGLPPVLTARERQELLQKWIDLGYPTHGFSLGEWDISYGASRPTFPDSTEMDSERRTMAHVVRIPDPAEWDAWKNYLMEEKLRALGVTPSTTEAPASTMSPFSSTMSRPSSTYPDMLPSPPILPMSATAMRPRMHSPFSPSISVPPGMPFPGLSQRTTPGISNPRYAHGYTQSVAMPSMQHRNGSPFGFSHSGQGGYFPDIRSPALQNPARRPWSPGHGPNMSMAPLNSMISPVNPSPQDFSRAYSANPQVHAIQRQAEAVARQQQEVQARIAHHRQMSLMPVRTMSSDRINQMPITPSAITPDREPPEIMQPTPRSHRHNLSAALEKGVTDSVAASAKNLNEALDGANDQAQPSARIDEGKEEGEIEDDEGVEQEELPILHRPETLKDMDENAEIETNPSNAGTPLLLTDKNPFATFQALPPPSETHDQHRTHGHSAQPSLSKFNVQAKEFSPAKASFSPTANVFSFDGNAFAPDTASPGKTSVPNPRFGHKHNPSSLGLNVAAPNFVPTLPKDSVQITSMLPMIEPSPEPPSEAGPVSAKPTFDPKSSTFSFIAGNDTEHSTPAKSTFDPKSSQMSTFSFNSASFNVEAPEFKPSGISLDDIAFTPEKPNQFSSAMFGDITIDSSAKSERRTKAVAIVKPQSREGSAAPEQQENFDEDGRAAVTADRFKRSKRVTGDNEEILFADSAPFSTLAEEHKLVGSGYAEDGADESISAAAVDEQIACEKTQPESEEELSTIHQTNVLHGIPDGNTVDQSTSETASSDNIAEKEKEEHAILVRSSPREEVASTQGFVLGAEKAPISSVNVTDEKEDDDNGPEQPSSTTLADSDLIVDESPEVSVTKDSSTAARISSTLSATAPAFESLAAAPSSEPGSSAPASTENVVKPKITGLMASKYASTSPPPPSTLRSPTLPDKEQVKMVERNSSPPQQMYGQPEVEAASAQEPADKPKSPPKSPVWPMLQTLHGRTSMSRDAIDTLERYKEPESRSGSPVSRDGDMSLDEINAVMKQFEEDPDLGIIREDTPVKSTPSFTPGYSHQFRSDAPSPSPKRRLDRPFDPVTERQYAGLGFNMSDVHQLNYGGSGEISDWNADLSPGQQDKLEARAHFFDDHVNDILDNIIENRLAPLERAMQSIEVHLQHNPGKVRRSRRSMSTDQKDSDADDEDDYDAYEGHHHYRSRSPRKSDRRQERIKAAVLEAMTVAQNSSNTKEVELTSIQSALDEMNTLMQQRATEPQNHLLTALADVKQAISDKPGMAADDIVALRKNVIDLTAQVQSMPRLEPNAFKTIVEDVLDTRSQLHHQLQQQVVSEPVEELRAKIGDLEALLRAAEKRADGEADLRREAEEFGESLHRQLREAQDQASSHRKAMDQAQKSLETFVSENDQYQNINTELRDLRDKNEALEKTLDEYRDYKEQLKDELETERGRTDGLARALHDARRQHKDQTESRDVLRVQLSQVQDRISTVMQDVRHNEAEWRKQEHDLVTKNRLLQAALDHETNRRARMELDAEKLNKEHRESLTYRSKHDSAQQEVSRLASIIVGLQDENKKHQDSGYQVQRELKFLQERHDDIITSKSARLQDEIDASKAAFENYRHDADARIARLQGQLNSAAVELQESKAKHDANMHRMLENHNNTIVQGERKHAVELEQRLAVHEDRLIDLRQQHQRDLANAAEDHKALEHRYTEKLHLRDDKVHHLEDKIKDLEERLEISNQAARAAVAAAAKGINLPTPAASVVASPPHRASIGSASMSFTRGSDLPEKISPQALRETIMVLQDQLQHRESKLDKLEAELTANDKEAPAKLKERDTEITMLRELLDVRIDDLQELIATLDKPEYSRAAVKDAAIRLRTQIKMEQQLKERAINSANAVNTLPTTVASGLVNLTQSPRAMVAAAAWGNWRKVRESGVGTVVSDFANNIGSQTPSRSSSASSGLFTPPPSMRTPSTTRPLAAAASARQAAASQSPAPSVRPLRAASNQPRTLSGARPLRQGTNESRPGSSGSVLHEPSSVKVEPPSTPLHLAVDESDFGDDVDDDASPLDGRQRDFDVDVLEQLPDPAALSCRTTSPQKTRSTFGNQASPRALTAAPSYAEDDRVEVVEDTSS